MNARDPLGAVDWQRVGQALDDEGHALLPGFVGAAQVQALAALADAGAGLRGPWAATPEHGVAVAFAPPWPDFIGRACAALRRGLMPVARRWRERLGDADGQGERALDGHPPGPCAQLHRLRAGEWQPLRALGAGAGGACPFVLVALLSEPGRDFVGGEVVLTERRPRMQSRAVVLPLRRGDAAIVATGMRPCRGANGWYRASLRQAVGRVHEGERLGLLLALDEEIRGQV
jgi:hypothetical protein